MKSKLCAVGDAEVAGQLHQQLYGVLVFITQKKISECHKKRHHQLVTKTWRTAVSKDGIPQHQSLAKGKLTAEQKSKPSDTVELREYFQFFQPCVKSRVMPP